MGRGTVCEIGFFYGFEYTGRIAPHVPLTQRNNELYRFDHAEKDPVGMLLEEKFGTTLTDRKKGVERAEFENGTVIVNHSSYRAESMNPEHAISESRAVPGFGQQNPAPAYGSFYREESLKNFLNFSECAALR